MELTLWAITAGLLGLFFAFYLFIRVVRFPAGTDKMKEISGLIHEGAMTYLNRQYRAVFLFILFVFVFLTLLINIYVALAYVFGGACSMLAGYIGMNAATRANVRTSQAASDRNQPKALEIAFSGGAVMGMAVASIG
ncbi:sodium/proton-translocating pyrophosphatase, partial [Candidatus Saganbacteria bacterium]|nr:sodium/proton-translocating pyrophosphatase [Candidatus Saganbacteria bacterium]